MRVPGRAGAAPGAAGSPVLPGRPRWADALARGTGSTGCTGIGAPGTVSFSRGSVARAAVGCTAGLGRTVPAGVPARTPSCCRCLARNQETTFSAGKLCAQTPPARAGGPRAALALQGSGSILSL